MSLFPIQKRGDIINTPRVLGGGQKMTKSKLRDMISLVKVSPEEPGDGNLLRYHERTEASPGEEIEAHIKIPLDISDYTILGIAMALLEDFQDGVFEGWSNPKVAIDYEPEPSEGGLQRISMQEDPSTFFAELEQLYQQIRAGDYVPRQVRVGDNLWEGSSQHIADSNVFAVLEPEGGYVWVHPTRTGTEHLTPFIDGKVEDDTLIVYDKGVEVIRERLDNL